MSLLVFILATAVSVASIYVAWSGGEGRASEGPEIVLETAIGYVISNHEDLKGLELPNSWKRENITPKRLLGATILKFTVGEWTAKVTFAPIRPSNYEVEIDYTGMNSFHWEGSVNQDGNVVETAFTFTN